jgi:hypothetical protein
MEQLNEERHLAISFQRVAKVAVVLARDFIVFLLHSAKENFKNLVGKIKLLAHGASCVKGIPDSFCRVGNAVS